MCQFMRQHHCQAGFVREHINQSTADHDRVTHTERLQRRREQHACAYLVRQFDVVSDLKVIDNRLQDFVYITFRSQQASALQAFHYVVFCLLLPLALSLKRRGILRGGAFVLHARIHQHLREFVFLDVLVQVIAPDAGLSLECDFVLGAGAEIALFTVDISRHPVSRHQVQAPAIHMEEVGILRPWRIRTIQANDAEILIFDPETTQKTAFASILLWGYIEHQAAHVA